MSQGPRTFALAVPSVCNILPLALQLRCHLLKKDFHDHSISSSYRVTVTFPISVCSMILIVPYFLIYFHYLPHLMREELFFFSSEGKVYSLIEEWRGVSSCSRGHTIPRNFVILALYLRYLEECLAHSRCSVGKYLRFNE